MTLRYHEFKWVVEVVECRLTSETMRLMKRKDGRVLQQITDAAGGCEFSWLWSHQDLGFEPWFRFESDQSLGYSGYWEIGQQEKTGGSSTKPCVIICLGNFVQDVFFTAWSSRSPIKLTHWNGSPQLQESRYWAPTQLGTRVRCCYFRHAKGCSLMQMVQWTLADVSETHFVRSILLDMFSTRTHERICTTLELCFAARMLLGP
jgi:hypothetical protein